jgi:hypothetical protein
VKTDAAAGSSRNGFWDNGEVIRLTNVRFIAFGLFCMAGAFLATGGKGDIFSRSRAEPISRAGRVDLFIAGLLMSVSAILRLLPKLRHYPNS